MTHATQIRMDFLKYPEHLQNTIQFDTCPDMFTDYENMIENENYDNELRLFAVPRDWATEWIRKHCDGITLEEFENVYEWDWSYQMYEDALAEGVIIEEHMEER